MGSISPPQEKKPNKEQQSSAAQNTRRLVHTSKDGNNGGCHPGDNRGRMRLVTAAERGKPMPKSPSMEAAGQCISPLAGWLGTCRSLGGQPGSTQHCHHPQMNPCRSLVDVPSAHHTYDAVQTSHLPFGRSPSVTESVWAYLRDRCGQPGVQGALVADAVLPTA